MYKINSSSQKILEKMLGKKYREIVDMDYDDEISYIQKKNNRKLVFSNKVDHRKVGRIKTMDKVNAGLSRIK